MFLHAVLKVVSFPDVVFLKEVKSTCGNVWQISWAFVYRASLPSSSSQTASACSCAGRSQLSRCMHCMLHINVQCLPREGAFQLWNGEIRARASLALLAKSLCHHRTGKPTVKAQRNEEICFSMMFMRVLIELHAI